MSAPKNRACAKHQKKDGGGPPSLLASISDAVSDEIVKCLDQRSVARLRCCSRPIQSLLVEAACLNGGGGSGGAGGGGGGVSGLKKRKAPPRPRARKLCIVMNCANNAKSAGKCIGHGGGKRCSELGCTKSAQGTTDKCKAHGGGKRCIEPDCTRSAQGTTDKCIGHGGGKVATEAAKELAKKELALEDQTLKTSDVAALVQKISADGAGACIHYALAKAEGCTRPNTGSRFTIYDENGTAYCTGKRPDGSLTAMMRHVRGSASGEKWNWRHESGAADEMSVLFAWQVGGAVSVLAAAPCAAPLPN
jgi:hypothetical protein